MINTKIKVLCPFCQNGRKGTTNLRAYLYGINNNPQGTGFKCFNCGIKGHATLYYNQIGETWYDNFNNFKNIVKINNGIIKNGIKSIDRMNEIKQKNQLNYISKKFNNCLIEGHIKLLNFLKNRKIPKKHYNKFVYVENYLKLYKNINNQYFNENWSNFQNDRVVIKYENENGIYALNGRSLKNNDNLKYFYIYNNNKDILFNIENVDLNKNIIVTEGEINSLFFKNSFALGSIHKYKIAIENYPKNKLHFIMDNDETGFEVSKKLLEKGFNVFSWRLYKKINNIKTLKNINDVNDIIIKLNTLDFNFKDCFLNNPLHIFML